MSLSRFHRATEELIQDGSSETRRWRVLAAQEAVRDRWLESGELRALVAGIIGNWTSGNCVAFMAPVTADLLNRGEAVLYEHLWSKSIKRQVKTFFREYSYIRAEKLTSADLLKIDTHEFNASDPGCYIDHHAAAAFLLKRLLADLECWRKELVLAGRNTIQPDNITQSIRELRVPNIEVPKLPPS